MLDNKKIAFVIGVFPATSETWMINQIADLIDRGLDIDIYSFRSAHADTVSERYHKYDMARRTTYIDMPENKIVRVLKAIPKILRLLFAAPRTLIEALNIRKYGKFARSLKYLFWVEPFVGKENEYDLIHLHMGTTANDFLHIKDIIGINAKLITSFYGYDISKAFHEHPGKDIYKRLKNESEAFVVMSNNMKKRVVARGFDAEKIHVIPISIDVDSYPFQERSYSPEETIQMISVGRFVEKKGFDDLLRALAIVKKKTDKPFICNIVGDGPLKEELHNLAEELGIGDIVSWKGFMKIEDVIQSFLDMHLYLQPSKTAADGDME